MTRIGLPHSEIPGSKLYSSSPRLIAGKRVLLRLSTPRHPPHALCSLPNLFLHFTSAHCYDMAIHMIRFIRICLYLILIVLIKKQSTFNYNAFSS